MSPQRIQRHRTKGWRMPEGAVYVGRGSCWGNPYRVKKASGTHPWVVMSSFRDHILGAHETQQEAAEQAVEVYELQTGPMGVYEITYDEVSAALAGKDLACWCPLDQPCHADVLLKLANPNDVLTTALADPEGQRLVRDIIDRKQGSHT